MCFVCMYSLYKEYKPKGLEILAFPCNQVRYGERRSFQCAFALAASHDKREKARLTRDAIIYNIVWYDDMCV